jgi:hypothetical protein
MIHLQEAIKKIIERYIVNVIPFSEAIPAGSTTIPLMTAGRFKKCDQVVVYNQAVLDATGEGEIRTISCHPSRTTVELDIPLEDAYPAGTSFMQKLVGGQFVQGIYLGDPSKISHYPAITINATEKTNEWLTLSSTSSTYNIDISIFTLADDYEESYRLMHTYAEQIETSLFRSLFPLAEPFDKATLANAVGPTDTVIRITDFRDLVNHLRGFLFLESWDNLRSNRIKSTLDAGVFQLAMPIGGEFAAGDSVIQPGRHFYNAFPRGIRYGTINKESTVLKAAVISYMAQEEVHRNQPYIDPLTF